MERDLGVRLSSVGGLQIPFHTFIFRMDEKALYVFFCLYEEGLADPAAALNPQFEGVDMLQRALQGRRHVGLQSLEIALSGFNLLHGHHLEYVGGDEIRRSVYFETRLRF